MLDISTILTCTLHVSIIHNWRIRSHRYQEKTRVLEMLPSLKIIAVKLCTAISLKESNWQ
jgi:hypothetical protein